MPAAVRRAARHFGARCRVRLVWCVWPWRIHGAPTRSLRWAGLWAHAPFGSCRRVSLPESLPSSRRAALAIAVGICIGRPKRIRRLLRVGRLLDRPACLPVGAAPSAVCGGVDVRTSFRGSVELASGPSGAGIEGRPRSERALLEVRHLPLLVREGRPLRRQGPLTREEPLILGGRKALRHGRRRAVDKCKTRAGGCHRNRPRTSDALRMFEPLAVRNAP